MVKTYCTCSYMVVLWLSYRCIFVNRYTVSNGEKCIKPTNFSTITMHKNYEEVTYEPVDQDKMQYAKPDITGAPTTTAISMQENPAYKIIK